MLKGTPHLKLWKHQQYIADCMRDTDSLLIKGDMRTGKTIAALEYIRTLPVDCPVLVITTKRGRAVWSSESVKYLGYDIFTDDSDLRLINQADMFPLAVNEASDNDRQFCYLINYERLHSDHLFETLRKFKFWAIILDESHKIKSHNSEVSKRANALRSEKRFCMTGTPLFNNPLDIFGQARFLKADDVFQLQGQERSLLTSYMRFMDYFCNTRPLATNPRIKIVQSFRNMETYRKMLNEISISIRAEDAFDMPEALHSVIRVPLSDTGRMYYKKLRVESMANVNGAVLTASNALVRSMRLHQLVGGFMKTDDGVETLVDTSKLDAAEEWVESLGEDEPCVIFFQHIAPMEHLKSRLSRSYKVGMLNGKHDDLKDWQQGVYQVLLVQTQSGAEGLDMSRAKYALFYSLPYSLGLYEQATKRILRLRNDGTGSTHLFYDYLVAPGTIDEVIYNLLMSKGDIVTGIYAYLTSNLEV